MSNRSVSRKLAEIQQEFSFRDMIDRNPVDGHYCSVSRYGYNVYTDEYIDDESVLMALVDQDALPAFLEKASIPANESMGEIGIPGILEDFSSKRFFYQPGYASYLRTGQMQVEPIIIRRSLPPHDSLVLEPAQDFVFHYQLARRQQADGTEVWDDDRNRCGRVIVIHNTADKATGKNVTEASVRTEYLLDYLALRQKALLVGYYRIKWYLSVPEELGAAFTAKSDQVIDPVRLCKYWIHIKTEREVSRPLGVMGRFDGYVTVLPHSKHVFSYTWPIDPRIQAAKDVTLLTRKGPVHPVRFASYSDALALPDSVPCDYMEMVYFDQQVLAKYEGLPGFRVGDEGDVHYGCLWGIFRGIYRIGYDLLSVHIGDWATGLDVSEWRHWQQYNVAPPSRDELKAMHRSATIPELVNKVEQAKGTVNTAYVLSDLLCCDLGIDPKPLFAAHKELPRASDRLKRAMPDPMPEADFLERMAALDQLINETIDRPAIVEFLNHVDPELGKLPGRLKLLTRALIVCKVYAFADAHISGANSSDIANYALAIEQQVYEKRRRVEDLDRDALESLLQEIAPILSHMDILFSVNGFRAQASHLGSKKERRKLMEDLQKLGMELDPSDPDYRSVFPELLRRTREVLLAVASVFRS